MELAALEKRIRFADETCESSRNSDEIADLVAEFRSLRSQILDLRGLPMRNVDDFVREVNEMLKPHAVFTEKYRTEVSDHYRFMSDFDKCRAKAFFVHRDLYELFDQVASSRFGYKNQFMGLRNVDLLITVINEWLKTNEYESRVIWPCSEWVSKLTEPDVIRLTIT